ncbi:MAG: LCP family protein [Clostridiales bacterium]|jgi:LCP family protein required for cell wall assembly|nr:LCP family protein [Clostridiales bacterium]
MQEDMVKIKQTASNNSRKFDDGSNEAYLERKDLLPTSTKNKEPIRVKMLKKFLMLVGIMVGIFLLGASVVIMAYNKSTEASEDDLKITPSPMLSPSATINSVTTPDLTTATNLELLMPPVKTNFLIVGKDVTGLLTDVILIGCFDRDSRKLDLISIPRDTYTVIPPERLERMRELGLHPPYDGIMKINAVNSYGGNTYGMMLLKETLEETFKVEINYQLEINLQAFRDIVDSLGGVYMDIPKPGLYYDDPVQSLHIAVPPGFQLLDGNNAEGVVRYRDTYRGGDIDRIKVQQAFMKALFAQVLERENIINNAYSICKAIINYAKTDFGLADIPKYLRYVNDLNAESIELHTLPGDEYKPEKISYYKMFEDETEEMVQEIFFKTSSVPGASPSPGQSPSPSGQSPGQSSVSGSPTTTPKVSPIPSKDARIEVLNGGRRAGIAATYSEKLKSAGYNIVNIDNYTGTQTDNTRIIVRTAGMGQDLKSFFVSPEIITDSQMPEDYDIIIIIGRDEE